MCVVGDFAWDVLIRTNSELLRGGDTFGEVMLTPGGSAANVAVWASRAGQPTEFIGKIGRDRFGQLAQEDLEREQVVAHFVETEAHLTGSVAVFVDHTGERSMVSGHGADFYLLPSELPRAVDRRARSTCTSRRGRSSSTRRAPRPAPPRCCAQRAGATLSFDPGSFQMIGEMGVRPLPRGHPGPGHRHPPPEQGGGQRCSPAVSPNRWRSPPRWPSCTRARSSCSSSTPTARSSTRPATTTHIPAGTNNLVDATGAGDSFAGGFLAHYLEHRDAVAAARFATTISAWVIEHLGARPEPDARLRAILSRRT